MKFLGISLKTIAVIFVFSVLTACGGGGDGGGGGSADNGDLIPPLAVDIDLDGFSDAVDCDDNNQLVHDLKTFYIDNDLDGFGSLQEIEICALIAESGQSLTNDDPDDNDFTVTPLDKDGDGTLSSSDCNDQDSSISLTVNYYADTDNDGYGAGAVLSVCSNQAPTGYVLSNADPDDSNAAIVPNDSDGDGIANADDCEANDSTKYVNQIYYADNDGDNLGSGAPVNICVGMPIPALDNYSLVAGDSCPNNINSNKDFDEDNIDDVCDLEIRVLSDKVISGDEYISFYGAQDGSKTFYFGASNNPVTVEFNEGSYLNLNNYATLYLEGGSKLILNKTIYDKEPQLNIANSLGIYTRIIGIGNDNKVELYGASITLGSGTELDNIDQIYVTTKEIYNPVKKQTIKYTSKFLYILDDSSYLFGTRYSTYASTAPTIKNSPGYWALYVDDQKLDVAPIKFLNNKGYPIKCVGDDFYSEENVNLPFSTCHYATYSRYVGNLFNGPLFDIVYTNKVPAHAFRYENEMTSLNIGAKEIYIENFSLQITDDVARLVRFQNHTIKARHILSKDSNGEIIDSGLPSQINTIPNFRAYNTGVVERSYIYFSDSDLRDVPLVVEGGKFQTRRSQVGAVLFPNQGGSGYTFGSFYAFDNTTLDFANSPYVVSDGTNSYGIGLAENFGGYVVIGSNIGDNPANTEDTIITDSSLRYPIVDIMPMTLQTPYSYDLITASYFRLTKSVELIGTDVDTVFGQDSSINSLFLKIK